MPDGIFVVFWSVPLLLVALLCFAVLREHGTPLAKRASWVFLAIAALPALILAMCVALLLIALVRSLVAG
ncbi:hypothetical protein ACGF0D_15175 [Kitasatospora sp. NPDC048298]|uniref:hypothetical protein n=1 Tax=Kitasatospora sp. NPDC048298 TaxID=3364049 RepID=UPI003711E765